MGSQATRVTMDGSAHITASTAADSTETNPGSDPANPVPESGSPLSGSGNTPSPGATPMHHAPEHHVGWQSLLPGSIQ